MEKYRNYLLAGLCGLLMGAGCVGGILIYRARVDATSTRAVIAAYQSALADWQRRAAEFAEQLTDARRDSVRGAEIAARLNELVARNAGYIATARNENERTVAQLRFAIAVYDILRQYYDPSYKAAGSADKKQGN
jgi:hypothetical protein